MTFEQAVERLSKKFLKKSGKVSDFNAEVCLTDEDCGGTFSIRVANGKVAVEPFDYHECDVHITCTYDNFLKFISDEEATYDLQCRSKRFADILAVVRKTAKGAKNDAADEKAAVSKKPARTSKRTAASKTAVSKTDDSKTGSSKITDTAKSVRKTGKISESKPENTESKPEVKVPEKIDEPVAVKADVKTEKTNSAAPANKKTPGRKKS
ncbi:MAG: hypothetical protein J1F64_02485 [Oscillospiraceae bacterium]|nr:hypothetical protein [Oscillospiraceae bacterium]